jgi:hypothetical protein
MAPASTQSLQDRVANNGAANRQHSYDRRYGKALDPDLDSIAEAGAFGVVGTQPRLLF